jgi:hypothetical protein
MKYVGLALVFACVVVYAQDLDLPVFGPDKKAPIEFEDPPIPVEEPDPPVVYGEEVPSESGTIIFVLDLSG